jgi:hypothetical protein
MPTLSIALSFSADDGEAEKFVAETPPDDVADGVYDAAEGNPTGSVRFDVVASTNEFAVKSYDQTFETWGVPPGATIGSITNFSVDGAHFETGSSNGTHDHGCALRIFKSIWWSVKYNYTGALSGDLAWSAIPAKTDSSSVFPCASTALVRLRLEVDADIGAGGSAEVHFDNINFDINYTGGSSGEFGTGALQAQPAQVAGEGTVKQFYQGTGALQAQESTVAGYAQTLPSLIETAKQNTADNYVLYADGVSVPLIQFTVRRDVTTETASITAPVDFEDIMAAAAVISIDMVSVNIYGAETVTELFTGALDSYSTSRSGVISSCSGAASWPANAVRDFGNVSYITDDANYNAYRLSVDPRFNPGDVGMFGLRRININRVTFSVNQSQTFMELSDVGQV